MRIKTITAAAVALVLSSLLSGAEKPRVFITESGSAHGSGEANAGEVKGSLAFTGGTTPQSVEVMKAFSRSCTGVIVTSNREKADFVIQLDHEALSPTTPFVRANKVAVFDKNEDLIYSSSSRLLSGVVKSACGAMAAAH